MSLPRRIVPPLLALLLGACGGARPAAVTPLPAASPGGPPEPVVLDTGLLAPAPPEPAPASVAPLQEASADEVASPE